VFTLELKIPMLYLELLDLGPNESDYLTKKFVLEVNGNINQINQIISEYNSIQLSETNDNSTEYQAAKNCLIRIYGIQQDMIARYLNKIVAYYSAYRVIQDKLLESIQNEAKKFGGMSSLLPHKPHGFSNFLLEMSQEKLNMLVEILYSKREDWEKELRHLYADNEPEYVIFQELIQSIRLLGGNNTHNFVYIDKESNNSFVLKVETLLDPPKSVERHVRMHSQDLLTPVYAERQGTFSRQTYHIAKRILITEFCTAGDLFQVATTCLNNNDEERIQSALVIYSQMADKFIQLQRCGAAFTDHKNENWLLRKADEHVLISDLNQLLIADSKSFLPSSNLNIVSKEVCKNEWYGGENVVHEAPALDECARDFSSDKLHALGLGLNLYEFLTGIQRKTLGNLDSKKYNFNFTVFETPIGQKLKMLIENLVTPNPDDRMSTLDAERVLLRMRYEQLLSILQSLEFKNLITPIQLQDLLFTQDQLATVTIGELTQKNMMMQSCLQKSYQIMKEKSEAKLLTQNIFAYIQNGEIEEVRHLISSNPSLLNCYSQNKFQTTPLFAIFYKIVRGTDNVKNKFINLAKDILQEYGGKINFALQTVDGDTPLHYALFHLDILGDLAKDILRLIQNNPAILLIKNNREHAPFPEGQTPLESLQVLINQFENGERTKLGNTLLCEARVLERKILVTMNSLGCANNRYRIWSSAPQASTNAAAPQPKPTNNEMCSIM